MVLESRREPFTQDEPSMAIRHFQVLFSTLFLGFKKKIPWQNQLKGETAYFDFKFHRDSASWWGKHCSWAGSWLVTLHLYVWVQQTGLEYNTSKQEHVPTIPAICLPRQHHLLETKYSTTWACGGHFCSSHNTLQCKREQTASVLVAPKR